MANATLREVSYDAAQGVLRVPYRHVPNDPLPKTAPMAFERTSKAAGKHWTLPLADVPRVIAWADRNNVPVEPDLRPCADNLWERELDALAMSTAPSIPREQWIDVVGLVSEPLDTQQAVIAAANRAWITSPTGERKGRALIVADEPGLGKTLVALCALRAKGSESARTVIICPTNLTENWHSEMNQHFELGTFKPWTARTTKPHPIPLDYDTVVIGWEILSAWADELVAWKPTAVVADEGHYAKAGKQRFKNQTVQVKDDEGNVVRDEFGNVQMTQTCTAISGSARASAALQVGPAVRKAGGLTMALTGTPIVNRPLELEPLLEFVGIIHVFGGGASFKNRFCGPRMKTINGRTITDYTGSSNLLELNARLGSSGHYVRRTKELLVDAGIMKRKYVDGVYCYDYVSRPNPWMIRATQAEMMEYRQAEDDLETFFAERALEIAHDVRASVTSQKVRDKVAGEGHRHLQRIATLRQIAAAIKVKYVVEKARELVAQGERVVIAAHHRDVVDLYADAFSGLRIKGEMGVQEIERAKMLFNSTPIQENPVLVLSVEAGKTGHTLCKQALYDVGPACRFMIEAEQIWTPGDESQLQDRIWRIGQDREVRIVNALLASTIDEQIYAQRWQKRQIVNAAVDAIQVDSKRAEKEGIGLLAWNLAARGLERR